MEAIHSIDVYPILVAAQLKEKAKAKPSDVLLKTFAMLINNTGCLYYTQD
jgi:hypothetical protein